MSSITAAPTLAYFNEQAERETRARAGASDQAAVALAAMTAGLKCAVFNAVAESRYGLVEEEVIRIVEGGDLARALLAALVQDGAVVERGGVFSIPQVAA